MGTMTVKKDDVEEIISTWIDSEVDESERLNINKISGIEL